MLTSEFRITPDVSSRLGKAHDYPLAISCNRCDQWFINGSRFVVVGEAVFLCAQRSAQEPAI